MIKLFRPTRRSQNWSITFLQSVFLCTDTELDAQKVFTYYRLRFQIELLLRDAQQHSGLEDCQARSKNKLAFHFNMSLSAVWAAKAAHYLSQPQEHRGAFSLQSIKRLYRIND